MFQKISLLMMFISLSVGGADLNAQAPHRVDNLLLAQLQQYYQRDARYNRTLKAVINQLGPQEHTVFPSSRKEVTIVTFAGPLGFNAIAISDQLILIDSVLLEGVKILTSAYVFYGKLDNPVTRLLVDTLRKFPSGRPIDLKSPNPFGLPTLPQLSREKKQAASQLFDSWLAFTVAHEVSHCHLEHPVKLSNIRTTLFSHTQGGRLGQRDLLFINSLIISRYEEEADQKAAKWILKSGFQLQGAKLFLTFLHLLDGKTVTEATLTHPLPIQRLKTLDAVEQRFKSN